MGFIGEDRQPEPEVSLPAHNFMMAWLYSMRSNKQGQEDGCVMVDRQDTILALGHNKVVSAEVELSAVTNAFIQRQLGGIRAVYCLWKPGRPDIEMVHMMYPDALFLYLYGHQEPNDHPALAPASIALRQEISKSVQIQEQADE